METFTELKELVENRHYQVQREKTLCDLSDDMIDMPIIALINGFNELPYCFTLQSCYGHFVYDGQRDSHNLDPLPLRKTIAKVEYRMAYVAFCIENTLPGRALFEASMGISAMDPKNVQFFCADWFWKRQVNSYALQVEPESPSVSWTLKFLFGVGFLTVICSFVLVGAILAFGPESSNPEPLFTLGNIIQFRPSRLFLFIIYFGLGIVTYRNRWIERRKFPGHFATWAISLACLLIVYLSHYIFVLVFQLILFTLPGVPGLLKFALVSAASIFCAYVVSQFFIKPFPRLSILATVMMFIAMVALIRP